jgi:hypothetical protein
MRLFFFVSLFFALFFVFLAWDWEIVARWLALGYGICAHMELLFRLWSFYFRFWNCSKTLSYLSWTGYSCWFEYRWVGSWLMTRLQLVLLTDSLVLADIYHNLMRWFFFLLYYIPKSLVVSTTRERWNGAL